MATHHGAIPNRWLGVTCLVGLRPRQEQAKEPPSASGSEEVQRQQRHRIKGQVREQARPTDADGDEEQRHAAEPCRFLARWSWRCCNRSSRSFNSVSDQRYSVPCLSMDVSTPSSLRAMAMIAFLLPRRFLSCSYTPRQRAELRIDCQAASTIAQRRIREPFLVRPRSFSLPALSR